MEVKDVAIIGSGPAGISAVLNAKIRNLSYYFFGNKNLSEKVKKSELIENMPGIASIKGENLIEAFYDQLNQMEIELLDQQVTAIYKLKDYYAIYVNQQEYRAKTLILAMGVESLKPVMNELTYLGRGVSYCATCDGNLYRDKVIAVVSQNKAYEHEVNFLASLAKKVYFFPMYQNSEIQGANIERLSAMVKRVEGGFFVEKVVLFNQQEIAVDGIFFLKDAISPTAILQGLQVEQGHIVVDREMKTNLDGCFAAGDATGRPYQIVKAMGEGNIALHSVIDYLNK